MHFTWIGLAIVAVVGLTKLLTYLLSDKRKIKELKARQYTLEEKMRVALATNDTVAISQLTIDITRVRAQINYLVRK